MVMPNLYGNIVSNIGAGLVGGAGVCSGKNVGRDYVVFEQGARHTGLELAFQNRANPTAMLLSSTRLLNHLGLVDRFILYIKWTYQILFLFNRLYDFSDRIKTAIYSTIKSGVSSLVG